MTGTGPVYARLLRLRHLRLAPVTAFLLFEGSVLVALVLALAEIINGWGVLVVPVAVAVMVKLNDIVAGVLVRPSAIAQLDTGRLVPGPAIGLSPMPRPARMTTEIGLDDAVPDPGPDPFEGPGRPTPRPGVARGIAPVPRPEGHIRPVDPPEDGYPPLPGPGDGRGRGNQGRFGP